MTTTEFLFGHIVFSIVGAGIGVLGLQALFTFLALHGGSLVSIAGVALAVVGNVVISAIFGMAAFGQSALGRLYLDGQTQVAIATYGDMYGVPLAATAAGGILLLVSGVVCLGIAVTRSRALPKWTGVGLVVGIVVFGVIGVILADVVQSVGAAVLIASTFGIAYMGRRAPAI